MDGEVIKNFKIIYKKKVISSFISYYETNINNSKFKMSILDALNTHENKNLHNNF